MSELDILKYDNKLLKEQVAYLKERINPFKLDIRDHFAGLAMQGLLSADPENKWDDEDCAEFAYQQADAMLKERSKSDE
jgi:hypothetical protein